MKDPVSFERIYLYPKPVDMRKQINGLAQLVENSGISLYESSLFLFTNKQKRTIKTVYWEKTGFCLWMMRLEEKKFPWPKKTDKQITITCEQFNWLIKGVDFTKIKAHESLSYQRFS